MNNRRLAHRAGVVCLMGSTIQIIYGLLAIPFGPYTEITGTWDELLWPLANVGMIGGALGLLALGVGHPRSVAATGAFLAILGNFIRIVASALIVTGWAGEETYIPLILASILLMVLGMGALGITTVLGKQLTNWQAWTPLLVPAVGLITAATYSIDDLYVHFILLGVWGVPWMLVGHVVFKHSTDVERSTTIPGSGAAVTG